MLFDGPTSGINPSFCEVLQTFWFINFFPLDSSYCMHACGGPHVCRRVCVVAAAVNSLVQWWWL